MGIGNWALSIFLQLMAKENLNIVYQDPCLLVINKPAGLIVESQKKDDQTLETILKKDFGIDLPRSGIVHRLDRDTSGLMVIAKTKEALINLQNQFASHRVLKIYSALVFGKLEPKKGTINIALKRDLKNRTRFVASKSKDAKLAITHYEVSDYKKYPISDIQYPISLLKVQIETGRTHQIRAHMFAIGHPVVGDQVYKNRDSEVFSKNIGLSRQFLHATELTFKHPVTGKKLFFNSDLPEDLKKILK